MQWSRWTGLLVAGLFVPATALGCAAQDAQQDVTAAAVAADSDVIPSEAQDEEGTTAAAATDPEPSRASGADPGEEPGMPAIPAPGTPDVAAPGTPDVAVPSP